jgi:hypothetical protein
MRQLVPRLVRAAFVLAAVGSAYVMWAEWASLKPTRLGGEETIAPGGAPAMVEPNSGSTGTSSSTHPQPAAAAVQEGPMGAPSSAPTAAYAAHCDSLTGWRRVLQLYAGHWDAVSVVASAGNTTAPAAEVHRAALCGRPLVLNAFGAPLLAAGQPCVDGWVSAVDGSCLEGAEAAKVSHA